MVLRRGEEIEENFGEPGEGFDKAESGEGRSSCSQGRAVGQVVVMTGITTVAVAAVVAFVIGCVMVVVMVMMIGADGSRFFERSCGDVYGLLHGIKHLLRHMDAEREGVCGKEEDQQAEGCQQGFMFGESMHRFLLRICLMRFTV